LEVFHRHLGLVVLLLLAEDGLADLIKAHLEVLALDNLEHMVNEHLLKQADGEHELPLYH
jgi:hypothetical protein